MVRKPSAQLLLRVLNGGHGGILDPDWTSGESCLCIVFIRSHVGYALSVKVSRTITSTTPFFYRRGAAIPVDRRKPQSASRSDRYEGALRPAIRMNYTRSTLLCGGQRCRAGRHRAGGRARIWPMDQAAPRRSRARMHAREAASDLSRFRRTCRPVGRRRWWPRR